MATQIFGDDHAILVKRPAAREDAADHTAAMRGNAFRGFFFAVLFNVFLLGVAAAGWELWRVFVR